MRVAKEDNAFNLYGMHVFVTHNLQNSFSVVLYDLEHKSCDMQFFGTSLRPIKNSLEYL